MKRTIGNWIALAAFTAVAVYLSWLIIRPFVDVIVWAAVLAVVSYPIYQTWRARRGWSPSVAALFTTLFVVLLILVPLALVGVMLARQIPPAVDGLQEGVHRFLDPNSRAFQWVDQYVDLDQLRDRAWLREKGQQVGSAIAARSVGIVGGIVGALVQMIFVLFTLYYLLKDSDRIVPAIRDALPLERPQADLVLRNSREVVSASLHGVLVISAIQGALGGIAFWFLGLPSPLLWGVVMFLLSMIPMAGAAIVWAPAAIYLLATGHYVKGVVLIAWGGLVIGTIDNFLRPKLVGERTRLHELIVFFSVLGGLQVFGILGLVVGPVVVSLTLSLVEVFRQMGRGAMGMDDSEPTAATAAALSPSAVTATTMPTTATLPAGSFAAPTVPPPRTD